MVLLRSSAANVSSGEAAQSSALTASFSTRPIHQPMAGGQSVTLRFRYA